MTSRQRREIERGAQERTASAWRRERFGPVALAVLARGARKRQLRLKADAIRG